MSVKEAGSKGANQEFASKSEPEAVCRTGGVFVSFPRRGERTGSNSKSGFWRISNRLAIAALFVVCGRERGATQTDAPVNQSTKSSSTRVIGRKLEEKGVPNFGQVTPTLYRGGLLSSTGLKALAKMGVRIVVDTHDDSTTEKREAESLGMQYVAIPWHCPLPKDEVFAKFLEVLQESRGKKVFVHCRLGDDRTGMMIAAYRMAEEGWSADEAMNEMRTFGFTWTHHLTCPGLANYEKHFPEKLRNSSAFDRVRKRD
jgi:tyrosine-protein phosphatase SIW14